MSLLDEIQNGRNRREEINAEWEKLGMERRRQSPAELRRVFMTWDKKSLVEMLIRSESDELKAKRQRLAAWAEAQEVHENTLILPRETRAHGLGHADPFNAWLITNKGQTLDAKTVFLEGWKARAKAEEAMTEVDG